MRLSAFRVQRFRNILDSTEIEVEPDVTVLVGKNEAGKTALLQALYRLNPSNGVEFDVTEHYPRWMEVRDRKAGVVESVTPISATFRLDEAEKELVGKALGDGVLRADTVTVSRTYSGSLQVGVSCDARKAIENIFEAIGLSATNAKRFAKAKDFADLKAGVESWRAQIAAEPEGDGPQALQDLETKIEGLPDEAWRVAWDELEPGLPTFFYFDSYSQLPGRVDLRELADSSDSPAASGLQTARALLELAGTDTSALGEETYEVRKAELEAVSNELTRQVFEYWKQNPDLSVEMDVDKQTIDGPNGQTAVARFLETRVKDTRHGYTNNFDQRSAGFQWFFSFLAAFSEFDGSDRPVVVLLDEPALSLHGRAQADYLRFIDERLASSHQVIYTTHSPFMVEPGRVGRARVVEDRGPDEGAITLRNALATDPDSLFPLQGALGYDIAQSLFIGPDNLVIEGTSDFTYLQVLSDHLATLDRQHLDPRWRLTPVGGAQNVPTFVALLGGHLDVTVLIDSATGGTQRLTAMTDAGLLDEKRLVSVGEILERNNADIEDLFAEDDYLGLYNAAFSSTVERQSLPEGDRIVKRLARLAGDDFDHGKPADYLLRERISVCEALSSETLDRFEKLFARLNQTLAAAT